MATQSISKQRKNDSEPKQSDNGQSQPRTGSKKAIPLPRKSSDEATISISKATGKILGTSKIHTIEDLKDSIVKAKSAQKKWILLSIEQRIAYVQKIQKYITQNIDQLSEIISLENGKTRTDALVTEIFPSTLSITYYTKMAKKFLAPKKISPANMVLSNKRSQIVRAPFGVIGIISPWNYPFAIPFSEVIMAILAGNAVILKIATETQMVGLALKKCFDAAGFPEGVFSYINMPGKIAGDAFLENGIDKLFFTGSVATGKTLMKKASETLTPVSLELGGNDAMLVCESADLYRAASGAVWAGFQNSGQSCGGVERIYVHKDVYDDFMAILKQKTENLRVGYDRNFNVDIGCMTTSRQRDTVNKHIADALEKGAFVFAKSKHPVGRQNGNCLPAVILTDVNHDMLVMQVETFGPVIGVMKVDDMEQAVMLANDSNLGLTGSVWSNDKQEAFYLAKKIEAGAITINDHLMSHGMPETPWGGFKESSIGRSHGEFGFDEMTQPKVIVDDILPFVKKDLWWHPFDKKVYDGIKGLLEVLYGRKWIDRFSAAYDVLKIVPRIFMR